MTWPGPQELGRGLVVGLEGVVPDAWDGAPQLTLDAEILDTPVRLEALIEELHLAWVERTAVVLRWLVPHDAAATQETYGGPVWSWPRHGLFPLERLRFLAFTNNYDARNGDPKWWWSVKASRIGATPGGGADVVLADGTPAWIDGGPRAAIAALGHTVIHGESVDLGDATPLPEPQEPARDGLAPDQYEAVSHRRGPARIIAPAGSGKTRTLTARLQHVLNGERVDPRQAVALAYNERAAAELRERLGVDRSLARTIHSLGWQILREARPDLQLLDERGVRGIVERFVRVPRRPDSDALGPYLEALSAVRSRLRDPADVEASRDDVAGFADAFELIRERMYATGAVDHGEQVYGAIEVLLRHPELRARWQRRCRHLLVDEFQDLTPAYLLLIRLVASPQLSVFGVGDDDQVIYGYDGADPGFLIDFDRYFPGSESHALEVNYRCPPAIVAAATHLLGYNRRRIEKSIRPERPEPQDGALSVRRLHSGDLAVACAEQIAAWLDDGAAHREIAVLARVNASLIPVKAALVAHEIPSNDLMGGGSLDRTAVRAMFAWMRLALTPEQMARNDLLEAIRRPSRGLNRLARGVITRRTTDLDALYGMSGELGRKQADRWDGFCDDLRLVAGVAATGDTSALVSAIVDRVGLGGSAQALDSGRRNAARSAHLDDLVAMQRAAALQPDPARFIRWLRTSIERRSEPEGVTLSSVHRVKGMEWPHVIIFGADRGAMPHDLAEDVEEERRVFHVALTRASRAAVVMADEGRPSRFLAELDGSAPHVPAQRPAPGAGGRSLVTLPDPGDQVRLWGGLEGAVTAVDGERIDVTLAGGGTTSVSPADVVRVMRKAATAEPGDPVLTEALKSWRRETAQRLGVPAYVVLHDKTIDAIAVERPQSERALLAISGIGPAKLDAYGDDILAVVAAAGEGE